MKPICRTSTRDICIVRAVVRLIAVCDSDTARHIITRSDATAETRGSVEWTQEPNDNPTRGRDIALQSVRLTIDVVASLVHVLATGRSVASWQAGR